MGLQPAPSGSEDRVRMHSPHPELPATGPSSGWGGAVARRYTTVSRQRKQCRPPGAAQGQVMSQGRCTVLPGAPPSPGNCPCPGPARGPDHSQVILAPAGFTGALHLATLGSRKGGWFLPFLGTVSQSAGSAAGAAEQCTCAPVELGEATEELHLQEYASP